MNGNRSIMKRSSQHIHEKLVHTEAQPIVSQRGGAICGGDYRSLLRFAQERRDRQGYGHKQPIRQTKRSRDQTIFGHVDF